MPSASSSRAAAADGCRGSLVRAAAPAMSQCPVAPVAVFTRLADRLVTLLEVHRDPVAIHFLRQAVTGIAPCRRRGRHDGTLLVPPRRLRSNKSGSKRCEVQAVERIEPIRTVEKILGQSRLRWASAPLLIGVWGVKFIATTAGNLSGSLDTYAPRA